jgi:tRNA threonylcarbamoyladenosine biosynthesis protein TsaE
VHLRDENATSALGAAIARELRRGMRIYLTGELGSGKTALVRSVLNGLGFDGRVKSPTYALVEPYIISSLYLYHFDFYRFRDPEEWNEAGFRELFDGDSVCLVEWPERAGTLLPPPDVSIRFSMAGDGRDVCIIGHSDAGFECVSALKSRGGSS